MEHSGFDEQIFNEFSGPLSPLGSKPLVSTVTTLLNSNSAVGVAVSNAGGDLCGQRLPDCNSILAVNNGTHSPKLDVYGQKLDFVSKMGCYSPTQKYDYIQQNHSTSPNGTHQQHHQQLHTHHAQQQQHQYSPNSPTTDANANNMVQHRLQQHHAQQQHQQQQQHHMQQQHHKHLQQQQQQQHQQTPMVATGEYHHSMHMNGNKLEYDNHMHHMYSSSPQMLCVSFTSYSTFSYTTFFF